MAKYDDAYFENLTKEANVIYRCLYLNEINDNLKNAIINYLDVYFDAYKKYSNLEQKDDDLTKIFNILGGPINEVDNPYNLSLNDGKPHPAIDFIKERLEKFYNELNNNAYMDKQKENPAVYAKKVHPGKVDMDDFIKEANILFKYVCNKSK